MLAVFKSSWGKFFIASASLLVCFIVSLIVTLYYLDKWSLEISNVDYIDLDKIESYAKSHKCYDDIFVNTTFKDIYYDCVAKRKHVDCQEACSEHYIEDLSYLACYIIDLKVVDTDYYAYIYLDNCYPKVSDRKFVSKLPNRYTQLYSNNVAMVVLVSLLLGIPLTMVTLFSGMALAMPSDERINEANHQKDNEIPNELEEINDKHELKEINDKHEI